MQLPSTSAAIQRFQRAPTRTKVLIVGGVLVGLALLLRRVVHFPPVFYWQGHAPWGPVALGFSNQTIAGEGCLDTCVAMAENAMVGNMFDPGDINDIAKSVGAFSGAAMFLEPACAAVGLRAPDKQRIHSQSGASIAQLRACIDGALAAGGQAFINVDSAFNKAGAHFVLAYDKSPLGYICADPATADVSIISMDTLTGEGTAGVAVPYCVVGVAPVFAA